jgi:sec-independent protein translocase protein TatB
VPGSQELLVIALVALFVLGPERLPEVARTAARLLTRIRNYGVTASKELRGVADLADLGDIEREVNELRRELERTRADLRRAMRETVASRHEHEVRPRDSERVAGAATTTVPDVAPEASAMQEQDAGTPGEHDPAPRDGQA